MAKKIRILFFLEEETKLTCTGFEKSTRKARKPSRIKSFPNGDEQIRWYRHICSHVFVDQGLMFKLHPL
jgi:hypothetical protein